MAAHPILIERPFVVTPEARGWRGRSTPFARFCDASPRTRGAKDRIALGWPSSPRAAARRAPDYTSLLTTTTSAKPTETETPVPIAQYLESAGVVGQPVAADKLTDLVRDAAKAERLGTVQQSAVRAGHPRHRQGRHLPHGDADGLPTQRRRFRRERRPSSTATPTPSSRRTSRSSTRRSTTSRASRRR